jgi:hypothetical protein
MCPIVPMPGRVLRSRAFLLVALSLAAVGNPTRPAHSQQVGSPPKPGIAMPGYPSPGSFPQQPGYGSGMPPGAAGTAPMPGGTWSWPPQTQVWPVQPGAQEIVAPDPGTQPLTPGAPTQTVVPEWVKPR